MSRDYEIDLRISEHTEDVITAAADIVVMRLNQAVQRRGRFMLGLSGGEITKRLCSRLAQPDYQSRIDWTKAEVFWLDEVCVPPDHADSNYRQADEALLSTLQLKQEQVHRIQGEEDPDDVAHDYEIVLGAYFSRNLFTFDVAILELGGDGHAAGLYAGNPAVSVIQHSLAVVEPPDGKVRRITVTLPVLNRCATALFIASGSDKAAAVHEIIDQGNPNSYPAGLVIPSNGELIWLLDRQAAGRLDPHA